MTAKTAALAALLAAGAGTGGMVVGTPVLQNILATTCKVPPAEVKKVGAGATTVTFKQAVNFIGQYCKDPENGAQIVEKVELKLIKGGAK